MADINEKSNAGTVFGTMEKRGRPILSAQERRMMATKQAGEQARFELENLEAAIARLIAKREPLVIQLEAATANYKVAMAELEAK